MRRRPIELPFFVRFYAPRPRRRRRARREGLRAPGPRTAPGEPGHRAEHLGGAVRSDDVERRSMIAAAQLRSGNIDVDELLMPS